jgi:Kef-type K+ transport system membrane component KefB
MPGRIWTWATSFLKPLIRALRKMNDRELKLSIIIGLLLFVAGLLDLWRRMAI